MVVYLYTYAENETDAENDAKQTIELLKKYKMNCLILFTMMLRTGNMSINLRELQVILESWVKIINRYMATMKRLVIKM